MSHHFFFLLPIFAQRLTELELGESGVLRGCSLDVSRHQAFAVQGLALLGQLRQLLKVLGDFSAILLPAPETHYVIYAILLNEQIYIYFQLTTAVLVCVQETTKRADECADADRNAKVTRDGGRVELFYIDTQYYNLIRRRYKRAYP